MVLMAAEVKLKRASKVWNVCCCCLLLAAAVPPSAFVSVSVCPSLRGFRSDPTTSAKRSTRLSAKGRASVKKQ